MITDLGAIALNKAGAQIDLIIERADNCINLCEIKFVNTEFFIDEAYAKALSQKREIFQAVTKTKKTVFTTLISPYGVKESQHYRSAVQNQLTLDDLF